MHPHLEVRPLVDPRAIPYLTGTAGFRPAATLSFGKSRQSKRHLQRQLDNLKRRDEDWDKRHASAEPFLLGSFPAYAASSTKSFNLIGALPPGQELREFQIVVEGTLKINAGTGQVQAPDYNVIGVALFNKVRASLYGNNDCYNLSYPETRTLNYVADYRDPAQQDPAVRLGSGLTTTAFNFKLKIKISFCHKGLEVPEIFSPCSDQANLAGSKIDLDTLGTALTTIGLASGAGTVTVSDIKVYAIMNQVPLLHAGPPMLWKSRAVAQSIDTESGQGTDLFVGAEEAATGAGGGARVSQWTVRRDGRAQPNNVDPVTLGAQYNECAFSGDSLAGLDITTGTIPFSGVATAAQPIPWASVGSQAGAAVVPLLWVDGRVHASAWQWPFWTSSRQIQQNLVAGQAATITYLYWQVRPVYEAAPQIVNLAAANGLPIRSVDDLQVRGGNDGEVNRLFKGRLMRLRPARGGAAAA